MNPDTAVIVRKLVRTNWALIVVIVVLLTLWLAPVGEVLYGTMASDGQHASQTGQVVTPPTTR